MRNTLSCSRAPPAKLCSSTPKEKYDWTPRNQVHTGPQPAYQPPPPDAWTDGDFLSQGRDQELNGDPISAQKSYTDGLAKFPSSFELLKAPAASTSRLFRFQEASTLLAQAETRATWDPEIHYYRGIAEAALGNTPEARIQFEAAHRSPAFREAGGLVAGGACSLKTTMSPARSPPCSIPAPPHPPTCAAWKKPLPSNVPQATRIAPGNLPANPWPPIPPVPSCAMKFAPPATPRKN